MIDTIICGHRATEHEIKTFTAQELPKLKTIYAEVCKANSYDYVVNAIFATAIYQKMED